jgi:hypothetical protein
MLVSNIVNDLYFNVELRDSLYKQTIDLKEAVRKNKMINDSIQLEHAQIDSLNEEIISEGQEEIVNLNRANEDLEASRKRVKVALKVTGYSLLVSLIINIFQYSLVGIHLH